MNNSVLVLDFDFFTAVGGGQTFYRRVVERNPGNIFFYPSAGPDLRAAATLPANARPFLFNPRLDVSSFVDTLPQTSTAHWAQRHFASQLARVAVCVQGMTFRAVDVPSFLPAAHLVRPVLTAFGVMVEKVALGLVGWPSASARNAYDNEVTADVPAALGEVERASLEAADMRYTISHLEAASSQDPDLPTLVLEMQDAVEAFPPPARLPPGSGPPDLWYVGRLDGAKGPDLFIELAARMPRRLYGRCMFAGPDNTWSTGTRWSDHLLSLAREKGLAATYAGTLSDAELRRTVYAGRTILVVPSRNDAFNYVALEGVLNGCPLLLSERTGAFGFLRDHHPQLLPKAMTPEDLDAAAASLRSILSDYPQAARRCRAALLRTPFPSPRTGFMETVYDGTPMRSPDRQARMVGETDALRSALPLLNPAARNWRRRRALAAEPAVTVVIPTLDRPALLAPTLACLTRQTLPDLEVVVVDDGSKDAAGVRDVAEAFAPLVRYLRIGNAGEAGAVNRGIAAARGRYVSFLSDDDAYAPELLAEAVAALDRAPDAVGAYPDWDIVDTAGCFVEAHRLPEFDRRLLIAAHWCLPGPGVVVRREVLERIGGRDLSFRFVSDFDLWLRATACGPMLHLPQKLAYWRLHTSNLTTSDRRRQMADERIRLIDKLFLDPAEEKRSGAYRATAYAAAHLAAAAILGKAESEAALSHLAEARRLDPELLKNLPPNMAGYPAVWPDVPTPADEASRAAA